MAIRNTPQLAPAPVECGVPIGSLPGAPAAATGLPDPPKPTTKGKAAVGDPPAGWKPPSLDAETIRDIGEEQLFLLEASEELATRAADGEELSPSDFAILHRVLPSNRQKFNKAWALMQNNVKTRRDFQARAGPAASRQAHRDEAERLEKSLAEQRAETAKIVEAEQQKIADAETKASQARSIVEAEQAAIKALQSKRLFPQHRLDEMQAVSSRWKSDRGHALETKRNRLVALESLATLDVSERRAVPGGRAGGEDLVVVRSVVEGLVEFGPDPTSRLKAFGMILERIEGHWHDVRVVPDNLDRAKWQTYLRGPVATEVAELREEIAKLAKLEASHHVAMEGLRTFYVPK